MSLFWDRRCSYIILDIYGYVYVVRSGGILRHSTRCSNISFLSITFSCRPWVSLAALPTSISIRPSRRRRRRNRPCPCPPACPLCPPRASASCWGSARTRAGRRGDSKWGSQRCRCRVSYDEMGYSTDRLFSTGTRITQPFDRN